MGPAPPVGGQFRKPLASGEQPSPVSFSSKINKCL